MRSPRVRFTVRRLMVAVALTGVVLGWARDRARRGYPLVVFDYVVPIDDEPLNHPTKILSFEEDGIALEDGRVLHIESGPFCEGLIGWADPREEDSFVDVENGPGDSVTVYTLKAKFVCGTCQARRYKPPIRIPLFARTEYARYRALVGPGKVVRVGVTNGS